ncbi:MAG: 23S rRNA (guanosine(2251)-2'-O)-methyltransferase RlmB [Flavobacteriaceae bacterium]
MEERTQIYGIRAVIEAINAEKSINKVLIQKGLQGSLVRELEKLVQQKGISASYVPVQKLNKLCSENHQGVVATISPIEFRPFEALVEEVLEKTKTPLFLLLDRVSDVRNFGAIIRTAECTGVSGIIIQNKGAAPVTADTVKTSAGAVFNVPIAKVAHLKDAIYYLQASGIQLVAASEKTEQSIYDLNFNGPTAIIMGSEDSGISPSILKIADHRGKLPMLGSIDSLNVSVACGIILYEVVRQRIKT